MSSLIKGYLSPGNLDSCKSTSRVPAVIYGSAWKGDRTAHLVSQALQAGFTAIDTAAQPKHYREDLVGEAVRQILSQETLQREDLFVITPPPFVATCCTRAEQWV